MWSYASLIGCNLRRLKAPLKGTSSHATHLAVYVNMIHAPREHDEKNGSPRIWGSALGQHSTTSRHNFSVLTSAPVMNVDHGGGQGDKSPLNLERRTLMQIVPSPRFCHIGTKMSVLWPSKYATIRFRPGTDPAGGAHDASQTP